MEPITALLSLYWIYFAILVMKIANSPSSQRNPSHFLYLQRCSKEIPVGIKWHPLQGRTFAPVEQGSDIGDTISKIARM